MPTFEYIALSPGGKQTRGSVIAESAIAARSQLRSRKLHATKLSPVSDAAQSGRWELGKIFRGKRRREILEFTRQLGTMIEANVQLTEALGVLAVQTTNPKLTHVVQDIRDQVLAGESLADCFKQFGGWFDSIYVAMVRVGELTGNLGRTLSLLADYLAKRERIEAKIKAALTYPAILVVISLLVIVVLMTFVVPKLTGIILSSGKTLPVATQMLMQISYGLTHYWWAILFCLFAGWWLFRRFIATPKGRMAWDRLTLKAPVVGELLRQSVVARFTSTLATLIRSGMPMADALQVVADVTGNAVMGKAVRTARERIMAGADVATPLRESGVVDVSVAHMISVGERTGEIEEMLVSISTSIEEGTDIRIQRLSAVIEPVVIVLMAVVIGFIVFATMLPIFQVSDIASQ